MKDWKDCDFGEKLTRVLFFAIGILAVLKFVGAF